MGYSTGSAARAGRRAGPARRNRSGAVRRPRPCARHDRRCRAGRPGRCVPQGAGRQRRRRRRRGASVGGAVEHVQLRRRGGPRVRTRRARGELAVGGGGRRIRRRGGGARRRRQAARSTRSRPRRGRRYRGAAPSSSCIGSTTCGAAAGSAPLRRGWAPHCRSSRCCASTWTAGWCCPSGSGRCRRRTLRWSMPSPNSSVTAGPSIVVHHVDNHDDADEIGAALTDPAAAGRVAGRDATWVRCCRCTSARGAIGVVVSTLTQ